MPEPSKQRSTEHYGLGQSGYTAGRVERDPSLEIEARNVTFPRGADEEPSDLGLDERFTGRGSSFWAPDEKAAAKQ